jgi:hypothetical protein
MALRLIPPYRSTCFVPIIITVIEGGYKTATPVFLAYPACTLRGRLGELCNSLSARLPAQGNYGASWMASASDGTDLAHRPTVIKRYARRRVVGVVHRWAITAVLTKTGSGTRINTAYIERLNETGNYRSADAYTEEKILGAPVS